MRFALLLSAGLMSLSLASCATAEDKDKGKGKDEKGTKIELGGQSGTTPTTWKKQTPAESKVVKRVYQFALPKAEGDKVDAELVIFEGAGGDAAANLGRWKGQYSNAKSKESKIKVGTAEGDMLDVSGTYNGPTFDPTFPGTNKDFRLLGIQVNVGDTNYHIKLHGPAKTVEKHKKEFEELLKGLKK